MFYKLTFWLLLPPMLLNGLWMVCNPPATEESAVDPQQLADCIRICVALEKEFGKICIIWPGNSTPSITIFDFGAAILPDEIVFKPVSTHRKFHQWWPAFYSSPTLFTDTPPPKV